MLTPEGHERLNQIKALIAYSKETKGYPRLNAYDIEWLADHLERVSELASRLYEELQNANEELAKRAEFD